MTLFELVSHLGLKNFTPSLDRLLGIESALAVVSDQPSDVLALARSGALLVTAQSHLNMVAVAAHNRLAAVLLTSDSRPNEAVTACACQRGVVLLGTELSSFDAAGQLYALGLRGGAKVTLPEQEAGFVGTGWPRYRADLHVHTCLSDCAEPEMTPAAIVTTARSRGLSMIAICDHDATGNCEPAARLSSRDLCVIAGIELTIEDEKHVLGLFGSPSEAAAAQAKAVGQPGNRPTLARAVEVIHACRGLAIAAHVDRPASGILGRGGRISRDAGLDAFELSRSALGSQMHATLEALGFPLTTASDSHCLDDIGTSFSVLELPNLSFIELTLAIRREQGRRCFLA